MSTLLCTRIGRLVTMDDALGTVLDAEVLCRDGLVAWIGRAGDPRPLVEDEVVELLDCRGRAALPGFVDCHTHVVFGGDRCGEFALRSTGVSYEEIARRGGGIRSTVAATRAASEDALLAAALPRVDAMLDRGVTTIEVKSGYGLDVATELKLLRVIRRLGDARPVHVVATFLGAHTLPAEYAGRRDAYVDLVCEEMLPAVAAERLATFCDVFCEEGAFTVDQSRRVLEAGLAQGLRPKLHAEQLHHTGGTALAVSVGAVSVDHLEQATDQDVALLAASSTTPVVLPGAALTLGSPRWAPARALLDAGVPVALATDCNPGSCMCDDLPLMTTLACVRLGMSPAEALRGITRSAARALACADTRGHLAPGAAADLVVLGADDEAQLPYRFGRVPPLAVVAAGRIVRGPGMIPG